MHYKPDLTHYELTISSNDDNPENKGPDLRLLRLHRLQSLPGRMLLG